MNGEKYVSLQSGKQVLTPKIKIMKRQLFKMLSLLAIMLLASVAAVHAQRWEWVKGYGSPGSYESGYEIIGTLTDGEGNLYFLGMFRNYAKWDDEMLLPGEMYLGGEGPHVIIAKISPQGDMVWKRVIHSNGGCCAYDIKKIGDTAFACMVDFIGPNLIYNLCWLDTLLIGESDYLMPTMIPSMPMTMFSGTSTTAYLKFGFDGTVQEQHFIKKTYVDYYGEDIGYHLPGYGDTLWLCSDALQRPVFDVDSEGNIYVMRTPTDQALMSLDERWSVENGTIQSVKVWVDSRVVGTIDTRHRPSMWHPHLMKFSPHFDTLLANRYVVQECVNEHQPSEIVTKSLNVDRDANIYITLEKEFSFDSLNYTQTMVFDSLHGMTAEVECFNSQKGFLIVFDSMLQAKKLIHIQDSITDFANLYYHSSSGLRNVSFDYDSNLVFISGGLGRGYNGQTDQHNNMAIIDGNVVNLMRDGFVISFDRDTWQLHSLAKVPAGNSGGCSDMDFVTKNNRIIIQFGHKGNLYLPDTIITPQTKYHKANGLIVFDYQGNVIHGEHYNNFTTTGLAKIKGVVLVDSIVYCTFITNYSATFGDITINPNYIYSYVAKYVDTSFMTPYVYVPPEEPPVEVVQVAGSNTLVLYPNPASNEIRLKAAEERILSATIVSASGVQQPATVNGDRINVSRLPLGIYFVQVTTDNGYYNVKFIKR